MLRESGARGHFEPLLLALISRSVLTAFISIPMLIADTAYAFKSARDSSDVLSV
jgi:hypothetical protein